MRACFALLLTLNLFQAPHYAWGVDPPIRIVQTLDEMKIHFEAHRTRVKLGAARILEIDAEKSVHRYSNISRELVLQYLSEIHDLSKFDSPISEGLFSIWNKSKDQGTEQERDHAKKIIALLNEKDEHIRFSFFEKNGSPLWLQQKLREIEDIADIVDRGIDPFVLEEMAKTPEQRLSGSAFLKLKKADPVAIRFAEELERDPRYLSASRVLSSNAAIEILLRRSKSFDCIYRTLQTGVFKTH